MIYWSGNLSFYLLHCVTKPNSQLRASLEQTRQAGVAVVWDGERYENERWGLSGLCVGKFKGDRELFLSLPFWLSSLWSLLFLPFSPPQREDTQRSSLPLFPTSLSTHFSFPSWLSRKGQCWFGGKGTRPRPGQKDREILLQTKGQMWLLLLLWGPLVHAGTPLPSP